MSQTKERLGEVALTGWRTKVANATADPLASRTPLSVPQARALVGAVFFASSVYYVLATAVKMTRTARE